MSCGDVCYHVTGSGNKIFKIIMQCLWWFIILLSAPYKLIMVCNLSLGSLEDPHLTLKGKKHGEGAETPLVVVGFLDLHYLTRFHLGFI